MIRRLLVATDLDRTLIPNGAEPESPGARARFARMAGRREVCLVYVSGRHRSLVEAAMDEYGLPVPDFVIGDVGTSIYRVGAARDWSQTIGWEDRIAADWGECGHGDLAAALEGLGKLELQEASKQNRCKLSYYVPLAATPAEMEPAVLRALSGTGARVRLIWSVDEPAGVGLLDVLPESASKLHALLALADRLGFGLEDTVFSGDSGNDLDVLASRIPAVLVANGAPEVRRQALREAARRGNEDRLYVARGGFKGMNGNYSGGILEGVAHYHPEATVWMECPDEEER